MKVNGFFCVQDGVPLVWQAGRDKTTARSVRNTSRATVITKRSPALLGTGPTPGYREILRPMWEAALVFVSSCLRTIVLQTYSFFSSSR